MTAAIFCMKLDLICEHQTK